MTIKGKERKQVPQLPDDIILEVFKHLPAADLARFEAVSQTWQELSLRNKLWQTLCLNRWWYWPPPRPDSSYYLETTQTHLAPEGSSSNDALLRNQSPVTSTPAQDQNPTIERVTIRPQLPMDQLPSLHTPHDWYTTSSPPYGLDSWKAVYRSRQDKDRVTHLLLDEIVEESRGRIMHMEEIVDAGVFEARDVLVRIVRPQSQSSSSLDTATGPPGSAQSSTTTTATTTDLTRSYYARKLLRKLSRDWVLQQWRQYRLQELHFPIWQGCMLISMFSNYELELAQVDRRFQELANEFLMISPMPQEDTFQFSASGTPSIPKGHGDNNEQGNQSPSIMSDREREMRNWERQVERFRALVRFFTENKRFRGNVENYYDPSNSCIDRVLESRLGIPISLCVVFAELAHRVGFQGVDLMGFPQHFMLRFQPTRTPTTPSFLSSPQPSVLEQMDPPVYYLDLFNPPHQLITEAELRDHFAGLNITVLSGGYNLPATPMEVFLRFLRNIYFAIEHTGGAGRLTSEDKMTLYSAMTQLLVLHPGEEWSFYLLWLKYLSENWPEDVGFVRAAIVEMETLDMRRTMASHALQARARQQHNQQTHHILGYSRAAGLHGKYSNNASSSASQTIIRFMQSRVRELEVYDDMGEAGEIRRRRRSKVTQPSIPTATTTPSSPMASTQTFESKETPVDGSEPVVTPSIAEGGTSPVNPPPQTPPDFNGDSIKRDGGSSPSGFGNQQRRPEPLYYVGEVFRHRFYRYMGVICGYDFQCQAEESWIVTMNVDSLPQGRNQPFYHALLANGTRTYVAQENIQVLFRDLRSRNKSRRRLSLLRKVSSSVATTSSSSSFSAGRGLRSSVSGRRPNADAEDQWPSSPSRHSNVHPEQNSTLTRDPDELHDSPESVIEDEHLRQQPERNRAINSPSAPIGRRAGLGLSLPSDPSSSSSSAGQISSGDPTSSNSGESNGASATDNHTSVPTHQPVTGASTATSAAENTHEYRFSDLGPLGTEDVGKFFEAWDGENGHYVMNKELRRRYPTEDYLW